jgi:VIT1/CCC1 family predicted Fe2+/Mn2+ transporter
LRKASGTGEAHRIIAGALPPVLAAVCDPADYENIRQKLAQLPEPPSRPRLARNEWLGALAVAFWVILTTFPVTVPFIFMNDVAHAMRVSNLIAVVLLFITGWTFGCIAEYHPWLSGLAMVIVGSALVALTMALGG